MSKISLLILIVNCLSFCIALKCSNCTNFGGSNLSCEKGKSNTISCDGEVCYVAKASTNLTVTPGKTLTWTRESSNRDFCEQVTRNF